MTEKEKMLASMVYEAVLDEDLKEDRLKCKDLCFAVNQLPPSKIKEQSEIFASLFAKAGKDFYITTPFWCDYGYNIEIGKNFYSNHNCVILDCAKVTFGDNVFVGPNCCFATAEHPLDETERNRGLETARPIQVGNSVWFGAGVTVLPGVTIGDNVVIGAGSIVTKDIPSNVVAVGNPARVIRSLENSGLYRIVPLKEVYAKDICGWKYEGEYSVYSYSSWEMAIRNHWEIADAKVRGQEYRGVLNKAGELTGYFKMHQDENGEVEIGLGMRPEECGQGKGADFVKTITDYVKKQYPESLVYLEVRLFNQRAVKCYEKAGYQVVCEHDSIKPWGTFRYKRMELKKED